ncbi:glucuronokinase 1-like, partial [Lingula anatina]|uniref:Glucuronokinase 1-like n=1 Tax=Lingula anatina TaxID=7574 RepID=A0A2R2MLH9_LINAN
ITRFLEKPLPHETESRCASVVFYCLRKETLPLVQEYLVLYPEVEQRNFGHFMQWIIDSKKTKVYGLKLPTGFQLIGQVGLKDYKDWLGVFANRQSAEKKKKETTKRAYARVGLFGNPSDGYYGKTISMSIKNFWAEVTITESDHLVLLPHPLNDPTEFGSLADLYGISRKEGYLGGLRLLQATCKKFYQYCSVRGIALAKRNFTLKYDTNIPRQVGLAGSSAIVTATLDCLMFFFDLTDARYSQNYPAPVDVVGGNYIPLNIDALPSFWLAYIADPSDSGKIHSNIKERWNAGDSEVIGAMQRFAQITDSARESIEQHDWERLAALMDENFDLRRQIFGDAALGEANLRMVEIARQFGSAVKFPGSGGAVIGLCLDKNKVTDMITAFQTEGFVVCEILPHPAESLS